MMLQRVKANIPNALTCCNAICGLVGITWVFQNSYHHAIYFVLLGGLFDLLDGMVARWLDVRSAIGKELDSLADAITFGALPAVYLFCLSDEGTALNYGVLIIGAFSIYRLANFNVDTNQEDKFIGLPTPANAIMITSISLNPTLLDGLNIWSYLLISVLCSFLLVSPIEMIALKFKSFGLKENLFRYMVIFSSLVLVSALQLSGIVFLIPIYIGLSVIMNLGR